jgi:hypothetical protein
MHSWPFSLKENGAAINPPLHSNREIALNEKNRLRVAVLPFASTGNPALPCWKNLHTL